MRFVADEPTVAVGPPFWDFDLSRHKSLRTLEVLASTIVFKEPRILTHVISTITSPAFSEVVIIYRDYDFGFIRCVSPPMNIFRITSPEGQEHEALCRRMEFEALREMHKVRDFRPVLCVDVWDYVMKDAVWDLKWAVVKEKAKGGFNDVFPEPLVISRPRGSPPLYSEHDHPGCGVDHWTPL